MSPDHLCEEGLAHREEIEIPFNVILFFSILLTISFGIYLNGHFYIFGFIARILFWIMSRGPDYNMCCFTGIFFIFNIFNIVTFTANATHIILTFTNLPVTVNTLHISDAPSLHRDKKLEEFLIGEIHCCNFINQDLTFLQPSTIYKTTTQEDSMLLEPNTTEYL